MFIIFDVTIVFPSLIDNQKNIEMKNLFISLIIVVSATGLFAQNIGIGTTTPTKTLDVNGDVRVRNLPVGNGMTDNYITVDVNGNLRRVAATTLPGDTDWLYIAGSGVTGNIYHRGKVGVGSTPFNLLGTLTVKDTSSAKNGRDGVFLDIINASSNTANSLAGIRFSNYNASTTNDFLPGGIFWNSTGQSFGRGDMVFATGATSSPAGIGNARMTITNIGNVGIGTTTPTSRLQVAGDVQISRTDKIKFGNNSIGDGEFIQNSFSSPVDPAYGLGLFTNSVERVRINNTGVGIGNSDPESPLHVSKPLSNGPLDAYVGYGNWGFYANIDNPSNYNYGFRALVEGNNSSGNYGFYSSVQDANQLGAYGMRAYANNASSFCYAVWASNSGSAGTQWAGYFAGRTYASGGAWTSSARKLKENIRPINGALSTVMALEGKNYTYKREAYPQLNLPEGNQYGFVADDVETILPEAVMEIYHAEEVDEQGNHLEGTDVEFKGMNYQTLIPILVEAIKEQQGQIEDLQHQNAEMKVQMQRLIGEE